MADSERHAVPRALIIPDRLYNVETEHGEILGTIVDQNTRVRLWDPIFREFHDVEELPPNAEIFELSPWERRYSTLSPLPVPIFPFRTLEVGVLYGYVRSRNLCLTIGDILRMSSGEETKLFFMDFYGGCNDNEPNLPVAPERFFRKKCYAYIHDEHLRGTLEGRGALADKTGLCQNFEFDIEFRPGQWCSVQNGWVIGPKTTRHYSTFPRNTRVGWRLCSICKWSLVSTFPPVFWHDPFPESVTTRSKL